ncbi:MAG: DUF4139 domain-containing protein [Planctomycetes bacterium]|nr:DUF4139 domain-containing protein [Planctomycetota bacterium]
MNTIMRYTAAFAVLLLTAVSAQAKNIDLSTVPSRATVQLTIYNSEDLTLVRETRVVSFKKGVNPLQFSWANTLIDPTSVELRFITNADKLEVADTTFPHDKPQMLYWNVQSAIDGDATVEITYFTSGISWRADYVGVASADETRMKLENFVRVINNSGEDYEDAQVRLVVGTINLVEKIAALAQVPMSEVGRMDADQFKATRRSAARQMMQRVPAAPAPAMAGAVSEMVEEKQVIKEGLSEYFIYTIDGTETIPNGWSKRMRSFEALDVPFKVQYRYRPMEYGDRLVRMYILTNDEKSKLGTTPMPDGIVRIFRDNGRDGLSFLAAQQTKYIPIGDKIEVNLGEDPEVIFELIKLRVSRGNIWMQINGMNVFKQIGGPAEIEVNSNVAGWDEHAVFTQRIRNYTAKQIEVEVRRSYDGHVTYRSTIPGIKLFDFRTVEFTTTVDAGKRVDLLHEVVTSQGRNAKQNNVTLQKADVNP